MKHKKYIDKDKHLDYKWLLLHQEMLFSRYGHCFIAIRNKRVIGVYNNSYDAYVTGGKHGTYSVYELLDPAKPIVIH